MSDRYETPRWDDDLEKLDKLDESGRDESVAARSEPTPDDEPADVAAEPDLDASSENVLEGWPVDAAEPEPEPEPEPQPEPQPETASGALEPDLADSAVAEEAGETPVPLADHVSATMEHSPGELAVPPGYAVLEGEALGERRAVGVVVARFNGDVTTQLLESALAELEARGVSRDAVTVMPVPGAFELPLAAMALAKTRRFACIVALGCVIRGDTPHFDYISSEAASGLQLAAIETGVPVAFGLLTLDRADQAESRVGKGAEAVRTGLEMADLFANLRAAAAR
jgi:6,7-dimethyl-8-ribityllumazine synthase